MNNNFRDIHIEAIKKILREEWDPIGVRDIPGSFDEYDMYAEDIYNFISSGKSERSLTDFLWNIEVLNMGLEGNKKEDERVSQLILNSIISLK
jgi:hypothetical protein